MEFDNRNTNGNTPVKTVNRLNEMKIKRDSKIMTDKLNPNLNSKIDRENARFEEKKIVNNKISQFKPMLNIDFHNVKR